MDDLRFALLLGSRICHDLISPVGAVNNGLEILADVRDDEMREEAMRLITSSAASASAKLQFLRAAFGASGAVAETVSLIEAKNLTESLLQGTDIELDWTAGDVMVERPVVKLLLNFIFIGYETLPRGGTLRVGLKSEGATNMMISAEGDKVRLPEKSVAALRDGTEVADAKEANLVLTRRLAQQLNATLHVMASDQRVEIAATI